MQVRIDALVVVIDGDGERPLGPILPYHILAENARYFFWLGESTGSGEARFVAMRVAPNNIVAKVYAIKANAAVDTNDQLLDLFAGLSA